MTRATPVIAAVGSALLIVAIATLAIRGADDGVPSADPTTPVATTPADPGPTTTDPADGPDPTEDPTDSDPTEDPTDDQTETGPTEDPTTDPDGGDVGDDSDDDDGDDMPETGGGALAVLGVGLAAAAATMGRRRA